MDTDNLLKNKLRDLAERAYSDNTFTFTEFLDSAKLDAFFSIRNELAYTKPVLLSEFLQLGSIEHEMIRFGDAEQLGYEMEFPITCVKVEPLNAKFSDELTHRDYLGALMNLGIKRETIGDIASMDKEGYILCSKKISTYIIDNLEKIKHTHVKCTIEEYINDIFMPHFIDSEINVNSLRIDAIVSALCKLSRNQSIALFERKLIRVNMRVMERTDYIVKGEDVISIGGYGKYRLSENIRTTKKNRIVLTVKKYS